jgi:hypothetical protein
MNKSQIDEKLKEVTDKYFEGGAYKYVGYVENIYGEPFIIFKVNGFKVRDYFVTGSELDWEVCNFYDNERWFSAEDERSKINLAIGEYEKENNY